ncbi:PLP-dependent aminotransferase family protein [Millisia brevis]|uniref:MocR-like transcription factor YczR n=1 Tax=Millisia brevis TaxID=264148 RepID=UPI000833754B|nr:PLP-dependent aminotransferase family protein [Millisia brevis]
MVARIPASRLVREIGGPLRDGAGAGAEQGDPGERLPAYRRLAEAIRSAVVDGRIPTGATLPSERSLTEVLDVSRTTVTRAYAVLVADDWAISRRGSGTVLKLPGRRPEPSGPLVPTEPSVGGSAGAPTPGDLTCAASDAPPGFAAALEAATRSLPGHLRGIGYHPLGLPELRSAIADRYRARGLPTDAENILVTPGALAAINVVARTYLDPGDRVVVESPGYPNSMAAVTASGARPIALGLGAGRWDVEELAATVRRSAPAFALLMPDFQNPTGALLGADDRRAVAEVLRAARVPAVIDETMAELVLDDIDQPPPFARFDPHTVTVGSTSKTFWGGLRVGWIRAPRSEIDRLARSMSTLFLSASLLDQLIATHLLGEIDTILPDRRRSYRSARDRLVAAVGEHLPQWRRTVPPGGLSLWCRLPEPIAPLVVAAAQARGVLIVAGHQFGVGGGLAHHVRLTYGGRADTLDAVVARVAAGYREVLDRGWVPPATLGAGAGLIA